MARKYSSGTRIGLHGTAWGPGHDSLSNTDATLDVAAEGAEAGRIPLGLRRRFRHRRRLRSRRRLLRVDRPQAFWDVNNATLPNFRQALTWAKALAESLKLPVVWWQVPVGNAAQSNTNDHWKDNRVDYFFYPDTA